MRSGGKGGGYNGSEAGRISGVVNTSGRCSWAQFKIGPLSVAQQGTAAIVAAVPTTATKIEVSAEATAAATAA